MKKTIALVLLTGLLFCGCRSYTLPSHSLIIQRQNIDVKHTNDLVQADANLPVEVRRAFALHTEAFQIITDWSMGKRSTPEADANGN